MDILAYFGQQVQSHVGLQMACGLFLISLSYGVIGLIRGGRAPAGVNPQTYQDVWGRDQLENIHRRQWRWVIVAFFVAGGSLLAMTPYFLEVQPAQ